MATTARTYRPAPPSSHPAARQAVARSPSTARRVLRGILVLAFSALVLITAAAVGWYAYFLAGGTIAPGVSAGGVNLAGLSPEEAAHTLDRSFNQDYQLLAIDTSEPARFWSVSPAEVGLRVDAEATAQAASEIGRGSDPLAGLSQLLRSLRSGSALTPVVRFDPEAARTGLERWAAMVNVPPIEAALALADGEVAQAAGVTGKSLDVEGTLALLAADPTSVRLTYQFIPLILEPVSPAIQDVSAAAAQIQAILDSEPALTAYDPVTGERLAWSPGREVVASWVRVERGEQVYRVDADPDRIGAYVEGLNESLGAERFLSLDEATASLLAAINGGESSTVVVHYRPTTRVVGPADTWISIGAQVGMPYWRVEEANPQVSGRRFRSGEAITIPPRDALLPLPIVVDKRIVISIGEQRLYTYEDGRLLSEHVVSTGIASSPTLPGIFQVQSHYENAYASNWDLWMPNFLGIYEAVPGFWNGIHGLPLLSNGVRLWANVLGRPASFGCIILPLDEAEWLYGWAEDGVVVEIRR